MKFVIRLNTRNKVNVEGNPSPKINQTRVVWGLVKNNNYVVIIIIIVTMSYYIPPFTFMGI